jgi:hypothetical protein
MKNSVEAVFHNLLKSNGEKSKKGRGGLLCKRVSNSFL